MNKCLITKLDTIINDSSLPILETMQQFTLDAIIKSGNTSMTDEQKYALNHFFYAIGAIDNNTTWSKVRTLFLPVISSNLDTAILDYKNDGVTINKDTRFIEQAGCLEITFGTSYNHTKIDIKKATLPLTKDLKDSAFLVSAIKSYPLTTQNFILGLYDNSDSILRSIKTSSSVYTIDIESGVVFNKRFETNTDVLSVLANYTETVNGYAISTDGKIINTTNINYGNYADVTGNITPSNYRLGIGSMNKFGIIVDFCHALTSDEIALINDAVYKLLSVF